MKKYPLLPILLLLAGFSLLLSCGEDANQAGSSEAAAQTDQALTPRATDKTMDTGAVPSDAAAVSDLQAPLIDNTIRINAYTGLLQGKWINEGDPGQTIQFTGNKMKYVTNGQLVEETDFSIDHSCESSHCLVNGEKPIGWCLAETSASGGKCKVVTRIDQQYFVFQDVTNGGGKVQYKKEAKPK
jgi:hypothetical protein